VSDAPAAQPGAVPIVPPSTPFLVRLGGSAFAFAAYFGMCAAIAASGVAQSAARAAPPGILFFLGACFGLVTIAVDSAAAYPFRELAGKLPIVGKGLYTERQVWDEPSRHWRSEPDWGLLTCAMCAGMWAGTILAALGLNVFTIEPGFALGVRDLVGHGLIGSATCWIVHSLLSRLGAYSS
jgi:hypothetical protein